MQDMRDAGMTLQAIAEHYSMSKQRVAQLTVKPSKDKP